MRAVTGFQKQHIRMDGTLGIMMCILHGTYFLLHTLHLLIHVSSTLMFHSPFQRFFDVLRTISFSLSLFNQEVSINRYYVCIHILDDTQLFFIF